MQVISRLPTRRLLLPLCLLFGLSAIGQPIAQGYSFVRFVADDVYEGTHLLELKLLNGEASYPQLPLVDSKSNEEFALVGDLPGNVDHLLNGLIGDRHAFLRDTVDGQEQITFDFRGRQIYLTGIRVSKRDFSNLYSFRVEGAQSADGPWELLYRSPAKMDNSYFGETDATGDYTFGTFSFGTQPVAVDRTPPPAPVPVVSEVSSNQLTISWPAVSDDASAIHGYEIFFDGLSQGFTQQTTFSSEPALTPGTDYEVRVVAYDAEFNASAAGSLTATTADEPVAEGFKYLRFWASETQEGGKQQLVEIDWMMGDRRFPLSAVTAAGGSGAITLSSTNENLNAFDGPYKAYDDQDDTHWFVAQGKEVTVEFQDKVVYPTGIQVTAYSYRILPGFRCEGSNDGVNWTTLLERSGLQTDDYVLEGSVRRGNFSFGNRLPGDLDSAPPTAPGNLRVVRTSATSADIAWDSSRDASALSGYEIQVDGAEWQATSDTTATVYGLSPQTSYEISVKASDVLGNVSATTPPVSLSTRSLAPALGAMTVGSGLSSYTDGIWKENVDFAAEWANYEGSNPFSAVFLDEIKNYRVLRFMDMISTNNNWLADWADRRQPDDPDQRVRPNYKREEVITTEGVAFEWMIRLCNLNRSNLWINVPHAATDDFIAKLADLIKTHLDPSLKVYVEYTNEAWGGFAAEGYTQERGYALGLQSGDFPRYAWFEEDEYARFRYYVYRSLQIHQSFNEVFGARSGQLRKVLAGWNNQPDVTSVHLDALDDPAINPFGLVPDAYAIAPYFGIKTRPADSASPLAELRELIAGTLNQVERHYAILATDGRNIPLITYEGGQHITNGGEAISRNPQIHQAYVEYLDALTPFIDLYVNFIFANPYARGMAWGAKEYIGQPDLLAYKYRAIEDWNAVNEDNEPNQAPLILDQPTVVTISEGSGLKLSPDVVGLQPITFVWTRNGVPTDDTGATLTREQLSLAEDEAVYTFTATNTYGTVESEPIRVEVVAQEKVLIGSTTTPITVDGQQESAWNTGTAYSLQRTNKGTPVGEADLGATFRTLWDDTHLYLLVSVTDDLLVPVANTEQPWLYDGIEVYLDASNNKTNSYDRDDRQIVFAYGAETPLLASGLIELPGLRSAQRATAGGYTVELAVPWADLGVDPADGYFIGFDVMVADNDTPGTEGTDTKQAWWATEDLSWGRPDFFGTAQLSGAAGGQDDYTDITVLAAGKAGTEQMALHIDGQEVARWEDVGGDLSERVFETFTYRAQGRVAANQLQVVFLNDASTRLDLRVDAITVAGIRYETEAPTTYSTGTWRKQTGCSPSYPRSEMLHCSGSFAFDQSSNVVSKNAQSRGPAEITLHPNPTAGAVMLTMPRVDTPTTVNLIDGLGRTVATYLFQDIERTKLSLPSSIAPGIYTVTVTQSGRRLTERLVVR